MVPLSGDSMSARSDRPVEVLGLARFRSMTMAEICAVFSETTTALLGPEDRYRMPTPLELELCELPRRVLDILSTGDRAARAALLPHLDNTLPSGTDILQISCQRIGSSAFNAISSEPVEHRADVFAEQLVVADRAGPELGQRWCVNLRLRNRALPQPWCIVTAHEGPTTTRRAIGRHMQDEANATVTLLYYAIHSAHDISRLYDASPARRERYCLALARKLVSVHGESD
jgi:hypothetical protein